MDHAQKIRSILNNLTSPLYEDSPFSTSRREPEDQCDGDCQGLTFQAFYNRVSTFGIKNWSSDPNAALYLAKYGFQNVSDFMVKCCSCSITIDLEVFLGKRDILATIATQSHKSNCRWLHLSTPGEYFQIPRNPVKAYEDFLEKVKNLLTFNDAIPQIKTHALSEELLQATKEENHANDLNSSAIVSAACMAVCGWEKLSDSIFHCRFCHRKCGIWSFVSVQNSVLGEPLPRKTPNRIVSLIINHINKEEVQDVESDKAGKNTPHHSEGLCFSDSPLGSKSTDKSESSSSDETDETNNVQVRRRLRSRSFFNAQTRKQNALKILRRKAALSQKWRIKTPTSSGGDSGPEEQENTEVKEVEPRNSCTSGESDQSVILVPRNDNRVNSRKKLMSENSTVQHNGYSIIGFSKDFHTSNHSDEVMNCDSEEGLPLVKSNLLKTDRQVELVPTNRDASKENDCVMPKIEFGTSPLEEGDHSAKNNKDNSSFGSTYEIKGVSSHGTICVSDSARENVPNREQREISYPPHEQNGESTDTDCIVINSTTSRCTSDEDDNLIRSTATTDGRIDVYSENCFYPGASNLRQNDVNNCSNTPTWEERQSKMHNKPKTISSLEERQCNANNNNHASNEAMAIEEQEYEREVAYSDGHYNEESYSDQYNEENQLSLVICSVVGNAVIPCDTVEDQMGVCTSPPKDKELSDGTIVLSDSPSKPDSSKKKCNCITGGVCSCATSKSSSGSEYYCRSDTEHTPQATTIMCNKIICPCCLKNNYYQHYYSEYPICSNSGYYRFNYSGYPHCFKEEYYQCNCSGYTSCLEKRDYERNDADNPLSLETEFNQGNNPENAVISEEQHHQTSSLENTVALENECCQGNDQSSPDLCQPVAIKEIEGRDSASEKIIKRKREHSPVHEMGEPKKKKTIIEEPNVNFEEEPKVNFDPLLEHRYWCMWKIKTEDPTGVSGREKAGWEFYMDAIKEGYRLKSNTDKRLSYNEERDRFFQCLEAISNLGVNCK